MEQLIEFTGNHLVLTSAFIALVVLLIVSEFWRRGRSGHELTALEAVQLMNRKPTLLLDVREDREYEEGHIKDARHIPLGQINDRVSEIEKYKNKHVIAYCRTGHRSANACTRLRKLGFESVYNLRGGITAWQRENLPLSRN